jgi:hypothetical protein
MTSKIRKGAKLTEASLRKLSVTLPKTGAELEKFLQEGMEHLPVADVMVMGAGFYAGYHMMTPFTLMMSRIFSAGKLLNPATWAMDLASAVSLQIDGIGISDPVQKETKKNELELRYKLGYASIGLIEAYMVTRPGFMSGMLNFLGQLTLAGAEAIKGIGEIIPL